MVHAFGSTDTAFFGLLRISIKMSVLLLMHMLLLRLLLLILFCGYASGSVFVATYASASDLGQSEVMGRVMVKVMVEFVALSTPRKR